MSTQKAELFNNIWSFGKYAGFSDGTNGQNTTIFLEALIDRLEELNGSQRNLRNLRDSRDSMDSLLPHVIEGGAGSGNHSLALASRGYRVTSVEYSEVAVDRIRESIRLLPAACSKQITVVRKDLLGYLDNGAETAQGFYANSVLHFFDTGERAEVYNNVYRLLTPGGLLAVSFKAEGDALQRRGVPERETEAGVLVRDTTDNVTRLFVNNPQAIAREMENAGYIVPENAIYSWEVNGYNYPHEAGKFFGFIGSKK